jgi:hypothetical protein
VDGWTSLVGAIVAAVVAACSDEHPVAKPKMDKDRVSISSSVRVLR